MARRIAEAKLVQAILFTLAIGPQAMSERLAAVYAKLLDTLIPRLRKTANRNLDLAMPQLAQHERNRIIEGSFRSIGRILVSLARFPQINQENVEDWIRYDGREHYDRAIAEGRGVLFATAHLGNWELSAFAHALMAKPMHVVVRPLDNPSVNHVIEARRALSGNQVIGKRDFARGILRALARNEAVGILIDQNVAASEGVFVDFFGRAACVSPSVARLAAHSGAAVIPGYALWSQQEQRFVLKFYAPIAISGDTLEDTRRIHAHLESVIRQYPDQWLWLHRRWKTRPPGEPDLY